MRTVALLLIGVQTLVFVPAMACAREGYDAPMRHHADSASEGAAVDSGDPCDACGMPDCPDMATCAAPTAALTADAGVAWAALPDYALDLSRIRALLSHPRDPVPPPPRV